jgi:hypothetical protein
MAGCCVRNSSKWQKTGYIGILCLASLMALSPVFMLYANSGVNLSIDVLAVQGWNRRLNP